MGKLSFLDFNQITGCFFIFTKQPFIYFIRNSNLTHSPFVVLESFLFDQISPEDVLEIWCHLFLTSFVEDHFCLSSIWKKQKICGWISKSREGFEAGDGWSWMVLCMRRSTKFVSLASTSRWISEEVSFPNRFPMFSSPDILTRATKTD